MFFSRIPVPKSLPYSEELLNKATRYLPFIGWIVGGAGALVFLLFNLIFPVYISVILSSIATVFLTGAFHEDGFADTCDGFGGGWERNQVLEIMKDSRIGTYGAVALVLILLLKITAIAHIDILLIPVLILTGHSLSRLMAVVVMILSDYARDDEKSKVKPVAKKLAVPDIVVAFLFGVFPLLLFKELIVLFALIPMVLAAVFLSIYFKRRIGGYTGDCLGATQQITEVIFYLSLLGMSKFYSFHIYFIH